MRRLRAAAQLTSHSLIGSAYQALRRSTDLGWWLAAAAILARVAFARVSLAGLALARVSLTGVTLARVSLAGMTFTGVTFTGVTLARTAVTRTAVAGATVTRTTVTRVAATATPHGTWDNSFFQLRQLELRHSEPFKVSNGT